MNTPNRFSSRPPGDESFVIPEELHGIAHSADRLAAADAASASEALDQRLFEATRGIITAGQVVPSDASLAPVFRFSRQSLRLAAAIGITLVGATLAGWLALRHGPAAIHGTATLLAEQPAQIQNDLDTWLAEAGAMDSGSSADLAALNADLASLSANASLLPPIDDSLLEESL